MNNISVSESNGVKCQYKVENNSNTSSGSTFSDILKSDDTDARIMNEINQEPDPIDREEDTILYNKFKKAGVNFKGHSLKWYKEGLRTLGFPPVTAPGYVRKAWREMLEKMNQQQRDKFERNIISVMGTLRYENSNLDNEMENPNFPYSALLDKMMNVAASIDGAAGFDYPLINKYLNEFKAAMTHKQKVEE